MAKRNKGAKLRNEAGEVDKPHRPGPTTVIGLIEMDGQGPMALRANTADNAEDA
jgi:hypothetical protein